MSYYYGFPEYVPVAQKRARAAQKLQALKKKDPGIQPVAIQGSALARTWWGKSWNQNLERYADYSNRIGRGRSYVRHGAVLDLKIAPGKVRALVQGSQASPYQIEIKIKPLDQKNWARLRKSAQGQLDSLADLLAGKFPKSLQELFFAKGSGLFPEPREISFSCSCPDWAYMCKHVAATLYGVGARLDEAPGLFFKLRKVEVGELVSQAVKSTTRKLLTRARVKSARVIEDADVAEVFGIELEDQGRKGSRPAKKKAAAKTPKRKAARGKPARAAAPRPKARAKAPEKKAPASPRPKARAKARRKTARA
jgi:uncharacterized Zn finger protein